MRTSERLLVRLLKEAPFGIADGAEPERLRHGRHQRSAGAWSWSIDLVDGLHLAGSQHSMRELRPGCAVGVRPGPSGTGLAR